MRTLARASALVCALNLGVWLSAQVTPDKPIPQAATERASADGMKLRADTAATVVSGEVKPEEAIIALKAHGPSSGLNVEADADFAFAGVDVGRRLVAAHKLVE